MSRLDDWLAESWKHRVLFYYYWWKMCLQYLWWRLTSWKNRDE